MDNMPKGTEILRQEVSEQCEENPPLPTQHAQAEVKANVWAGIATSSNATTTSQDLSRQPPRSNATAYPGSTKATCLGSTKATYPGSTRTARPGSEETTRPGSKQTTCLGSEKPVYPGSTQQFCPGSIERICPGSKSTFCFSGEQNNDCDSNCLNDEMTNYSKNKAQSMVIPPTICVVPKSLLMEMFKKSEDNDTWKLDDFRKNVPSIDFQRILAEDCHGTIARWSVYMNFKGKGKKDTSIMVAQREVSEIPLAQVFLGRIVTRWRVRMDYKNRTTINIDLPAQVPTAAHYLAKIPAAVTPAQVPAAAYYLPKFLPTVPAMALPPKTDLARRIDRSKRRQLTFMAYPRDFNKAIIQVIKDKFPESSTRSQCLNKNLPTSLPWHHIPKRQKLDAKEEYRQSL
ncbi:hypothetical protein V6N13_001836 [Hibiscus sabdariffa]